jgi:hypothetical protein
LAIRVTREPLGLVTTAGADGVDAAGVLAFGAAADLRAGAGAVVLVAGAGVLAVFVVFFMF